MPADTCVAEVVTVDCFTWNYSVGGNICITALALGHCASSFALLLVEFFGIDLFLLTTRGVLTEEKVSECRWKGKKKENIPRSLSAFLLAALSSATKGLFSSWSGEMGFLGLLRFSYGLLLFMCGLSCCAKVKYAV